MAKKEPKVRVRTKERGDTKVVKTVTKEKLPNGGKVKTMYKEIYGPNATIVKSREKVKGAEDIPGRKMKTSLLSYESPSYGFEKKTMKSKGPVGSKIKSYAISEREVMPKEKYMIRSKGKMMTVNLPETTETMKMSGKKEKGKGYVKTEKMKSVSGGYDIYGKKMPSTLKGTEKKKKR